MSNDIGVHTLRIYIHRNTKEEEESIPVSTDMHLSWFNNKGKSEYVAHAASAVKLQRLLGWGVCDVSGVVWAILHWQ